VQSGFLQIANMLVDDKRLKINNVNSEDRGSALHIAAKSNYLPICQVLLIKGVDLTIKDKNGLLAKEVTTTQTIKTLIEKYEQMQPVAKEQVIQFEEIKEEEGEEDDGYDQGNDQHQNKDISHSPLSDGAENFLASPKSPPHISSPVTRTNDFFSSKTDGKSKDKQPSKFTKAFNMRQLSPKSSMATEKSVNSPKPQEAQLQAKPMALQDIIATPMTTSEAIDGLLAQLKSTAFPYESLFPLKMVKGKLYKVHRLKLNSYSRYIYINPIEGALISYQSANKFPLSPNYIMRLNEITDLRILQDSGWYQKKNMYYFQVRTAQKNSIFYLNNLDLVQFWINEIHQAKMFYGWLQSIIDMRYSSQQCSIYECHYEENQQFLNKADELINLLLNIRIPEVDMDQYHIDLGLSAQEFAKRKAQEFTSLRTSLAGSHSSSQQLTFKSPSTGDLSDEDYASQRKSHLTAASALPNAGNEIVYEFETDKNLSQQLQKNVKQMLKIQREQNEAEVVRSDSLAEQNARQKLSKSTVQQQHMDQSQLLDDSEQGIGYNSFQLIEILGQGTFGKVFKVKKRESEDKREYAMKVLKKAFLVKNNHLRYAITEANILKLSDHPFVVKLHYSFQTPENLYMILDYCPGGDLAFHLNKKQIFDEAEARFFIAEVVLAMEYIHALNIIYRDLKPENILIDRDGHAKLADFGLAKEGVGDKQNAKSFCGSPAYLAPEMLLNKGVGKAADIYQIGAVLYELLVGFPPYYTENIKKLYENIKAAKLQIPTYISPSAKDLL